MNAPASSEEASPLQQFVNAHPWLFALAWVVMIFPMSWLISHFLLARVTSGPVRAVILETGLTVVAFVFLSLLRWWHHIGFTKGIRGGDVPICLFPTLLTVSIAWGALSSSTVGSMIFFLAIYACLIAVAEESIFRGIILQTLLPKGVLRALFLSTLIFALLHVGNLFAGRSWAYVSGQVLFTFGDGMAYAVMRVRTGSIWPAIILHGLTDFGALAFTTTTGIKPSSFLIELLAGGSICSVYMIYAAIALRPSKLRELRARFQPETRSSPSRGRAVLNSGSHSRVAVPEVTTREKQRRHDRAKSHPRAARNRHH
jgi:membrane protease YdiL (CAAX protease family)